MMRPGRHLCPGRLHRDQLGQVTVEYAIIVAAIAIPMLAVFRLCLHILTMKYRMMTCLNSLVFP